MKDSHSSFFDFLNLMRVLFAFIVFIYHLSYPRYGTTLESFYQLELGHYAVAGFFFISGFFITRMVKSNMSPYHFLKNRAWRIYSVLMAALLVTWLADSFGSFYSPELYTTEVLQSSGYLKPFLSTLVFINYFWDLHIRFGSNGPLWSLTYEVWYYLAIFLFYRARHLKIPLLLLLIAVTGPALWLMFPCYLLGCLFYNYKDRLPVLPLSSLLLFLAGIFVLWFSLGKVMLSGLGYFSWHSLATLRFSYFFSVDWLFSLLFFFVALIVYQRGFTLKRTDLISFFSDRSFSLYVFHYPLMLFFLAWWKNYNGSFAHLLLLGLVTLVTCLGLSAWEMKTREWK